MSLVEDFCAFVDSSPSPFHVCANMANRLAEAGFVELREIDSWPATRGKYYVQRSGSLIAWNDDQENSAAGWRVIGAHSDSPNLRVKQNHDLVQDNNAMMALEPYGGALLDTWLDRDLGLSGRVITADSREHLVLVDEAIARVPHLAIHLDRDNAGAHPDRQQHVNAIWALGQKEFLSWLSQRIGLETSDIAGFELMAHPIEPAGCFGPDGEFLSSPRLDNQLTCFAGLTALLDEAAPSKSMLAIFDHEEVGSMSERGAQSDFLATTLERIVLAAGGDRQDVHRQIAASICASGDMAHATHPNYPQKHEPLHRIELGGGPVVKINQNLRYASDAKGTAVFAAACQQANVPLQRYLHRADLPCGSTIGPMSAARTGMLTVDVGAPQLAMHSACEMMATSDIDSYVAALGAFLNLR